MCTCPEGLVLALSPVREKHRVGKAAPPDQRSGERASAGVGAGDSREPGTRGIGPLSQGPKDNTTKGKKLCLTAMLTFASSLCGARDKIRTTAEQVRSRMYMQRI